MGVGGGGWVSGVGGLLWQSDLCLNLFYSLRSRPCQYRDYDIVGLVKSWHQFPPCQWSKGCRMVLLKIFNSIFMSVTVEREA